MFDPKLIISAIQQIPSQRFLLAYSGGLDSHVLLDAFAFLRQSSFLTHDQFTAIHINHGWHQDADQWTQHCASVCQNYAVNFQVININAKPIRGISAEAHARKLRYQALASVMQENDCLLTAHHQDDQTETFLLQLLRGAGVKGLAAMPILAKFHSGYHARPLLNFSRRQLHQYAIEKQLHWIDDDSNFNEQFDRNYLRHKIIPLLKQRWPSAQQTIARSAQHCAETDKLIITIAENDLTTVQGQQANQLNIIELKLLSAARRANVLRFWLKNLGYSLPTQKLISHIETDILQSNHDSNAQINWQNVCLRRYKNYLYVCKNFTSDKKNLSAIYKWQDLEKPLLLNETCCLKAELKIGHGIRPAAMFDKNINVRFRQGGERLQPITRQGSHPLKKLMQEWQIPPWQRGSIPLIYCEEKLIAVVGYAIDASVAAKADEPAWTISLNN